MFLSRLIAPTSLFPLQRSQKRRRPAQRFLIEAFEPRQLFSGSYLPANITGTWSLAGLDKTGLLTFDGVSAITAGTWTQQDGSGDRFIVAGTGSTFDLGTLGVAGLTLENVPYGGTVSSTSTLAGLITATRDVIPLNEISAGVPIANGLNLLVNHSGAFVASDLAGTWNIAAENFRGTVKINAAGHVTGGQIFLLSNQKSSPITGGSATLNANGTGTLALNTNFTTSLYSTVAFNLTMNNARDALVANNANIAQPVAGGIASAELAVLLKSAGKYASADVINIPWTLNSALGEGTITFHANKSITGILHDSTGLTSTLTGNFSIGGNGSLITNITATAGATVSHFSLTGAINRAKNLVALDRAVANPGSNSSLTILSSAANHAPTERATALLPQSAYQSSALTITYDDITQAAEANDLDGDALTFLITAVPSTSGTLQITHNGSTSAALVGTTFMEAGDTLIWTPAVTILGEKHAFSVRAFDGDALANNATKLLISTAKNAVVSAKTTKNSALESKAGTHAGDGKIEIQRVGGDISQPLDVTLAIGGTAVQGVNYHLLAPNGITVLSSPTPTFTIPAGVTKIILAVTALDDATADPELSVFVTVAADPNSAAPLYVPSSHDTARVNIIDGSPFVAITPFKPTIAEGVANARAFIVTRLPAQGGNVNGSLTVNLAYGGTFDSNYLTAPASVTFAAGEVKKVVTVTTIDNQSANAAQTLTATLGGPGFAISGSGIATVQILDAAPVVRITVDDDTASEASPSNRAKVTIHRTGATTAPLTVDFTTSSGGAFGTLGTNYSLADANGTPVTTSIVIPTGKESVAIFLTAIDDHANDPVLHPVITLQPDAGPSYNIAADQATLNIINKDRRPTVANATASQNTTVNTAINFTYDDLVSLMGATLAPAETNGTLQLKVTAKFLGTLQLIPSGGVTPIAAPVGTIIDAGDTLVWTPPTALDNTTRKVFTLAAIDGSLTASLTTRFSVVIS